MTSKSLFIESVRSNRTTALFISLTSLFFALFVWHVSVAYYDGWSILSLCLSIVFLFYVFNYRTLTIRLEKDVLLLKFGIFTLTIPRGNIDNIQLDEIPLAMKYGGAGIHFMLIKGRYRVSFNFLEYPRVVIALKSRQGLVRDVSFSTQKPDELIHLIKSRVI